MILTKLKYNAIFRADHFLKTYGNRRDRVLKTIDGKTNWSV